MSPIKASEAQFLFEISGKEFRVVDFTAQERISSLFEVNLTLASEDEITFDDVIGKEALLTIESEEKDRYFHGIICQFMQTGSKGNFFLYQARMVPSLWLLSLEQDCRIFQNKSVKDIIQEVLQEGGIPSDRFSFKLQNQYQPKEYCVQYRETDLNFISRLLEDEGIFYFFKHKKDGHFLVFGDSTVNYQSIKGKSEVLFHPADAMVPEEEVIHSFLFSRQIRTGKFTLKDFNFEKPLLDLKAQKQDDFYQKLEVYDYPGKYIDETGGKKLVQVRLQESLMFKDRGEGQSGCPRLISGFTYKLNSHDIDNFNQEYLLVEVFHSGSQPQALEEFANIGDSYSYSNDFVCIPSSVTFRPERKTPKPIVEGIQTAIVVGPAGEEIYTEEHGRIKVQFHWDREGKKNENSSCWIRVSHIWAGAGWGAMYIPRIGQEVIIDFLEGDPDRPLITGCVYNGENKPPYKLPDEKTKSTIKSNTSKGGGSFNELLMEDNQGKTHVVLSNAYGHKITEDEETQTLTIETRDQNLVRLDDKNKNITVQTTNNHQMIFDDENKKIVMKSTDGYTIELDDGNKKMIMLSKNGQKLEFDDEENKKITLVTADGNSVVVDDNEEKLSVVSKGGHSFTLDDSGNSVTLEDSKGNIIKLDTGGGKIIIDTGSGSIDITAASGKISMSAMDIEIAASNSLKVSGGLSGEFNGGVQTSVKGVTTSVEGSAMTEVKGALVKIN